MRKQTKPEVAVLLYSGVTLLDLIGPQSVLIRSCNCSGEIEVEEVSSMNAIERRLLIAISIVVFSALYVASWYWLYPGEFDVARFFSRQ